MKTKTKLFALPMVGLLGATLAFSGANARASIINVPGNYATIQAAISAAALGDTIQVAAGVYPVAATIVLNKAGLTISGDPGGNTVLQTVAPSYAFQLTALGVTLQSLRIWKTDKASQNLIYIGANNATVQNCEIAGQYVMGENDVSRGFEVAYGSIGIAIQNNTIHGLRQPGYFNGSLASPTTGVIANNYVAGTRGWVMAGANMTFTGNTWGTGADVNYLDIAILAGTPAAYYPNIAAISAANNDAVIEDQRSTPAVLSVVYVNAAAPSGGDGTFTKPYQTITAGITRAAAGGTVLVAAGTYAGNIAINKSLTLIGDPGDASAGPGPAAPIIEGNSLPGDAFKIANGVTDVTIKGFEMRNFTSPLLDGIGNGVSAWVGSTARITITDNYFHNLGYNAVLVGNDWNSNPAKWGDHRNWLIKNNVVDNAGYIGFELTNTSDSSIEDNMIHLMTPYIGAIFSSARL